MPDRRGSWPALLALAIAFVLLFYWQRSRSTFLRIEQERPAAAELAGRAGIDVADALALRDLIGLEASVEDWQSVAIEFAAQLRLIRAANGSPDPGGAVLRAAVLPEIPFAVRHVAPDRLAQRRFMLLRERFAARR
ncbi:MAG: hypothetical protein ACI8UD_003010 [Planctomycetota bacterium]